MCYHILTHTGKVISRSMVHQVTNLELYTDEFKETFVKFDTEIHRRLKAENRGYKESKPIPQDREDILEEYPDFSEELKRVFNNADIPESDYFTPEVLEDTYVDMDIALPKYGEGPDFDKVTKRLRDANGIPIGRKNENSKMDTRIYEFE